MKTTQLNLTSQELEKLITLMEDKYSKTGMFNPTKILFDKLNNLNNIRKKEDELRPPKYKIGDKLCYYDTFYSFMGVVRGTGVVGKNNNKIYLIEGTQDNSKEIEWFEFSVENVDEWAEIVK
jgi:hypothetical protein